jgi:uncharacterized GH25 family protein
MYRIGAWKMQTIAEMKKKGYDPRVPFFGVARLGMRNFEFAKEIKAVAKCQKKMRVNEREIIPLCNHAVGSNKCYNVGRIVCV